MGEQVSAPGLDTGLPDEFYIGDIGTPSECDEHGLFAADATSTKVTDDEIGQDSLHDLRKVQSCPDLWNMSCSLDGSESAVEPTDEAFPTAGHKFREH